MKLLPKIFMENVYLGEIYDIIVTFLCTYNIVVRITNKKNIS